MKIKMLGVEGYDEITKNLGDCILIDTGEELIVYDCGCEEHAKFVEGYMKKNGHEQLTFVLSHNDADHFNGINYLIDKKCVKKVVTTLLLKYKDEILDKIDDNRRNRDTVGKKILEIYDNISSLSERVSLENIYTDQRKYAEIVSGVNVAGPSLDYMIDAVAKGINSSEGDTIDGETIVNATSVQILVDMKNDKVLLTGDSSFEAIKNNLKMANVIQLPHHGKASTADKVFDELFGENEVVYLVSDNTGNTNGGSDKLNTKGHIIMNTKDYGNIDVPFEHQKFSTVGTYQKRFV